MLVEVVELGVALGVGLDVAEVADVAGMFHRAGVLGHAGLKWPPVEMPSRLLQSPNSWMWKPCGRASGR